MANENSILVKQLWDILDHPEAQVKTASATQTFLRDRLRETSVLNRVIPPISIGDGEVERNTNDLYPLKRIDIEPDSKALSMGYRNRGQGKWFEGSRYEVYFNKYESEHFQHTMEEMATMDYPVRQVVENNFIMDIQEALDKDFRKILDAAALLSGQVITIAGYVPKDLKAIITEAQRMILDGTGNKKLGGSDGRRRATRAIMTESRQLDIGLLDIMQLGTLTSNATFETARAFKTFTGLELVTSINSRKGTGALHEDNPDIKPQDNDMSASFVTAPENDPEGTEGSAWPVNSIYVITAPEFLGSNFIYRDVQQEFKRRTNQLEWWAWSVQGAGIGNIRSVVRIDFID